MGGDPVYYATGIRYLLFSPGAITGIIVGLIIGYFIGVWKFKKKANR